MANLWWYVAKPTWCCKAIILQIKINSWITVVSWRRSLLKSMNWWAMLCRTTKDGWVRVKSSDKTFSTRGGNDQPLHYSCHKNPMTIWKAEIYDSKMSPPQLKGVQYAVREEWRIITNNFKKNQRPGPKHKWHTCGCSSWWK